MATTSSRVTNEQSIRQCLLAHSRRWGRKKEETLKKKLGSSVVETPLNTHQHGVARLHNVPDREPFQAYTGFRDFGKSCASGDILLLGENSAGETCDGCE
eukprot:9487645-Pyramimonas_sp.AAC.1